MKAKILQIHPLDNAIVALTDLAAGEQVSLASQSWTLVEHIPAKHKFAAHDLAPHEEVRMYGVLVGKAATAIPKGALLSTTNIKHLSASYTPGESRAVWTPPNVARWQERSFMGYHRADGSVGTANHWLVIPLVFCENHNIEVLRNALVEELGYGSPNPYRQWVRNWAQHYQNGSSTSNKHPAATDQELGVANHQVFSHIDGIKFLTHDGGCGGIRQDAQALCGLLAGYITHPNTAGATILSLGCQNAQVGMLQEAIRQRSPQFNKPLIVLEQQQQGTADRLISEALRLTLEGMVLANEQQRQPAPLSKLCIGLECGGSDGFSGLSANPLLGRVSDVLVALGGAVILAEFPELCGVEQELCDRCVEPALATRFSALMQAYQQRATAVGSGFDMNPSPGNIRDGLITDAMKSAGAARKGGSSPIVDVIDYPEKVCRPGLNLLCTPGNDVESTTAEVAAGANVVLFTTGLGTPTGNPIAPVIKVSSNTALAQRMPDIIDFDAGGIITGDVSIEEAADQLLEYVVQVASGEVKPAAVKLGQDDFIPWKRGISL